MFRLEEDNTHATRQRVRFGRASINTIEIAEGLVEGDRVILSDTSRFDDEKRVRLK
jgi:hypothetical protein